MIARELLESFIALIIIVPVILFPFFMLESKARKHYKNQAD